MTSKSLMTTKSQAGFWMEPIERMFSTDPVETFQTAGFPVFSGKGNDLKIEDRKKDVKVSLKTPGYDKKHLKVSVKDGMLTFCGERNEECRTKDSYASSYGSFTRSIPLPYGVNAKKAKVEVKNGEVDITMPKNSCR